MKLRYKTCNKGVMFGIGPMNGNSLRVFCRKVRDVLIFDSKKITNNTFNHIFYDSGEVRLDEYEKRRLGEISADIRSYDWDPDTYQGQADDVILNKITKFLKPYIEKAERKKMR